MRLPSLQFMTFAMPKRWIRGIQLGSREGGKNLWAGRSFLLGQFACQQPVEVVHALFARR